MAELLLACFWNDSRKCLPTSVDLDPHWVVSEGEVRLYFVKLLIFGVCYNS